MAGEKIEPRDDQRAEVRVSGLFDMPESPPHMQKLHRGLLAVCIFFFAYLIIEAIVLFPYMILEYGWW